MDEMGSPHINIYDSLMFLEVQENEYQIVRDSVLLKEHILSLKMGLRFLERFFNIPSYDEDLEMCIVRGVFDLRRELHSLSNKLADGSVIPDLDIAYMNLREKMKNVIGIREYDGVFLKFFNRNGYLKKINSFILEGFGDLSSYKAALINPSIREELRLLQPLLTYVADTGVHLTEETKQEVFNRLAALLGGAACLLYSCLVDKMDEEMTLTMNRKLSALQERIKVNEMYVAVLSASRLSEATTDPPEREFFLLHNLMKLLDCNANSVIHLSGSSEKLHDQLKFLKAFLGNLSHELRLEKSNYLVTSIESIAWKAVPILSSCYVKEMKEDMAKEVNGALFEVLDQIKDIQAEAQEIKNYPKTDVLGFLGLLLEDLRKLLNCRPELIENLKNEIKTLHDEFDFLRSFIRIIKEHRDAYEKLGDLSTRIIGLAYEAEYVIDIYLANNAPGTPDPHIISSLCKTIRQTMLIKSEVTNFYNEQKYHAQSHNVAKTSSHVPSQGVDTTTEEIVGFEDEVEKIMEYLFADRKKLDVVSIVGMPGLGKTTLAKKIYKNASVVKHFDVQAWCVVSQTHQKRDLLLNILSQISQKRELSHNILGGFVMVPRNINNKEIKEINRLSDEELACADIAEYFSAVELLIHLTYLAVEAKKTSIPVSIANLWNLQFFIVKAYGYYDTIVVNVPDSLWDMVNLRHVHIDYRASFGVHQSRLEKSSLLDDLEVLSTPFFSSKEDAENLLRRLPKLRKLRCIFLYHFNHSTNCYEFPALDYLDQLLSLKVFFRGSMQWGQKCEFKLPINLRKLSLLDSHLMWDEISRIGRSLPNLEVLKLIKGDRHHTWIVNDGDFPKLRYLKLNSLHNIREWIASEDSFPTLEQLVLDNCTDLSEIPPCFGEIPTLQMISVSSCNPSADDSARRIHRQQLDELQNTELKVYIYSM